MILFSLLLSIVVGCGGDPVREQQIDDVCAQVTNENWYNDAWVDQNEDAQEVCKTSPYIVGEPLAVPCTLGGMPFACREHVGNRDETGVYNHFSGILIAFITPEDRTRIGDDLKLIR